jgi:hypothetical protein
MSSTSDTPASEAVIDGILTRYTVAGSGPPLLMFSPGGFNATMSNWETHGIYQRTAMLARLRTVHLHHLRQMRVRRIRWPGGAGAVARLRLSGHRAARSSRLPTGLRHGRVRRLFDRHGDGAGCARSPRPRVHGPLRRPGSRPVPGDRRGHVQVVVRPGHRARCGARRSSNAVCSGAHRAGERLFACTVGGAYLRECLPAADFWDAPVAAQTAETAPARVIDFLQSLPA